MERKSCRVCVTGGAGYIASWLVKKLLHKGHTVHATLRNLGDQSKVGLLKGFPGAENRLVLFEADIYDAETFETAIQGCEFVFLVATPFQPQHAAQNSSKYNDSIEAAVDAVRIILRLCEESGSVKRVIYTGSVTSTSPLKEDGTGYKESVDESCWTPLHLSFAHCEEPEKFYTISKTLSEKELLSHNEDETRRVETVSLACGLVGGDTLLPEYPLSVRLTVSPLNDDPVCQRPLKFLQALVGSVPLVHIDDVCEAHAFCVEQSSMTGRYLCAVAYPSLTEILEYYGHEYPTEMRMIKETEGASSGIPCSSTKLADLGFRYRYGLEQILDDNVRCMRRLRAQTS
ncbi:putative vestitone reductase isoform X1 [Iris pallida]|uniref:Vestitone reductase isoform X1 n=1 Tax=Iris pallida TaxID=29817 RepID=A0AAX6E7K0_IRIPA|nr:putative vestitone reductase isoform X1 [Iris pallida]